MLDYFIWAYIAVIVGIIGFYGWLDHRNVMREADEYIRDL